MCDGTDAELVPRGDAERMALALGGMIADPERASRLGMNAYRHACETFDLPRVAARLDLAVRRVAAARSAQLIEVTA
jgi:glycosyltransferase involved in cell wall biosynthesis